LIALATCRDLPDGDPDDRPLRDALGAAFVAWDDPDADWDAFDTVVVRSTWDYVGRREAFLDWAERAGKRLHNPAAVLRWNTDKRYLADLAAAGLPVVDTAFVAPGERFAPDAVRGPLVVKPTVSAGARDTARHDDPVAAGEHVAALHAGGRVAMVQPYVEAVEEAGETALLYLDGAYSHAIRKGPLLVGDAEQDPTGLFITEDIRPREPSPDERAAADRVMDWVTERFGTLLYARVDLLPGDEPALLELELTEPSLFLAHADGATERLARAIAARA
jgi:hypothetical protein